MTRALVPPALDAAIESAIDEPTRIGLVNLLGGSWPRSDDELPLFIKFTGARYGAAYAVAGPKAAVPKPNGLYVSASPGFTWGKACYATPLLYPVSTAIYGRCGVVAQANPDGWRLFDATDPPNQQLYLDWVSHQPYRRLLMLTTHSQIANQFLRNTFRKAYRIDCVVFPPDEADPHYTRRKNDRWLAVSEWNAARELSAGFCTRFQQPRLSAVLAEEFEVVRGGLARRTMIGPMSTPLPHAQFAADFARAYNASDIATVTA